MTAQPHKVIIDGKTTCSLTSPSTNVPPAGGPVVNRPPASKINEKGDVAYTSFRDSPPSHDEDDSPRMDVLWVCKMLYLFHGLGSATWGRFSCIYYLTKGLTTFEIGIIEGLMPVMKMFCGPLWGYLADRTKSKKYVYLFCRGTSSAILCLLAFPQIAQGFISILVLSIINVSFVAMGVLEAFAIEVCGNQKQKLYGRIRLWQSIAAGLGAVGMGLITDQLGFTANFIGWGVLATLNCSLIAWKIPNRTEREKAAIRSKSKIHLCDFFKVVAQEWWFFLIVIVFGMGLGVIDKLLFVYLTTDLQASTSFCGLSVAVTVIVEIPLFHYGRVLLTYFGRDRMLGAALAAYIIRVFGYTLLTPTTVWWILPLEVLHGLGFSNVWLVSIDYSSEVVPRGWNSTMQTFLRSLYLSVGAGVGAVSGGWVMQHYGANTMYTLYGLLVTAFLFMHIMACFLGLHSFDETAVKRLRAEGYALLRSAEDQEDEDDSPAVQVQVEEAEEEEVNRCRVTHARTEVSGSEKCTSISRNSESAVGPSMWRAQKSTCEKSTTHAGCRNTITDPGTNDSYQSQYGGYRPAVEHAEPELRLPSKLSGPREKKTSMRQWCQ